MYTDRLLDILSNGSFMIPSTDVIFILSNLAKSGYFYINYIEDPIFCQFYIRTSADSK